MDLRDLRPLFYRLDEQKRPVPLPDSAWGMGDAWQRTAETFLDRKGIIVDASCSYAVLRVSTAFLGIDHRHSTQGPPILWETMVFAQEPSPFVWEEYGVREMSPETALPFQERYTSHEAALAGHAEAVAICQKALTDKFVFIDKDGTHWPE